MVAQREELAREPYGSQVSALSSKERERERERERGERERGERERETNRQTDRDREELAGQRDTGRKISPAIDFSGNS